MEKPITPKELLELLKELISKGNKDDKTA